MKQMTLNSLKSTRVMFTVIENKQHHLSQQHTLKYTSASDSFYDFGAI